MKLEVGMYVRGFRGINKIIKIEPYNDTFFYYTDGKEGKPFYFERHIKKSSFNLIDLIEVGDYVNGKLIHSIQRTNDNAKLLEYGNGNHIKIIKEVLTHELYENNTYKVVE